MADFTGDASLPTDSTLDIDNTAQSLTGSSTATPVDWNKIIKMAMQSHTPNSNTGALAGGTLFSGYKQNVPVAQIAPIPDVEEKKSDQGLSEAIDWITQAYGGGKSTTGAGTDAATTTSIPTVMPIS